MRRTTARTRLIGLALGATVLQGCPIDGLINGFLGDCFGEDTISSREYDRLNFLEQLLYEENDCGRYEPISIRL